MIAYWNRFGHPGTQPGWVPDIYLNTWWLDKDKDAVLKKYKGMVSENDRYNIYWALYSRGR